MSMFQAVGHLKLMGRKLTQPMAAPPGVKHLPFSVTMWDLFSLDWQASFLSRGGRTHSWCFTLLTSLSWVMEIKVILACTFTTPAAEPLHVIYGDFLNPRLRYKCSRQFSTPKWTGILSDFSTRQAEGSPPVEHYFGCCWHPPCKIFFSALLLLCHLHFVDPQEWANLEHGQLLLW